MTRGNSLRQFQIDLKEGKTLAGPKKGRYHVFIDESEIKDQNILMLGAVLVPFDNLNALEHDLNQLRLKIRASMQRHAYPVLHGDPRAIHKLRKTKPIQPNEVRRLRDGGLPEIHTKDMWQSTGSYMCLLNNTARNRRNVWIGKALSIFKRYNLSFYSNTHYTNMNPIQTGLQKKVHALIDEYITEDLNVQSVDEIIQDPHFRMSYELFYIIDSLKDIGVEVSSVTVDKGKKSEIFGKLSGFDRAREYGYWTNFPNPEFIDSHESSGIQMADLATYFAAKFQHSNDREANDIYMKFVFPVTRNPVSVESATLLGPGRQTLEQSKLKVAVYAEAALLHCGGEARTLVARTQGVEQIVRHLLAPMRND